MRPCVMVKGETALRSPNFLSTSALHQSRKIKVKGRCLQNAEKDFGFKTPQGWDECVFRC